MPDRSPDGVSPTRTRTTCGTYPRRSRPEPQPELTIADPGADRTCSSIGLGIGAAMECWCLPRAFRKWYLNSINARDATSKRKRCKFFAVVAIVLLLLVRNIGSMLIHRVRVCV